MYKGIQFVIVLASAVFVAGGHPDSPLGADEQAAIEKAVIETNAKILRSAENVDVDETFRFVLDTDKGAFIADGKLLLTRQDAYELFSKSYAALQKQKIVLDQQHVTVLSRDVAILTGEGRTNVTIKDGPSFDGTFAMTAVFVRKNGEWKVLHGHQSIPNRRPAAAPKSSGQ